MVKNAYQTLLDKIQQEKQSNTTADAAANLSYDRVSGAANQDIKNMALLALGVGAAGRGAQGVLNTVRRNLSKPRHTGGPVAMPLPYREEEKTAESTPGSQFMGSPVTRKDGVWYYAPGMVFGGLAAGYGGWKGIDKLLDSQRRASQEDQIKKERQKFEQALLGGREQPHDSKQASEQPALARDLDNLFELLEKRASDPTWGDRIGQGVSSSVGPTHIRASTSTRWRPPSSKIARAT